MLKPAEFSSLFHIFIKIQEMMILLIIILRFCASRNLLVNICFEVSLTQLCMSIRHKNCDNDQPPPPHTHSDSLWILTKCRGFVMSDVEFETSRLWFKISHISTFNQYLFSKIVTWASRTENKRSLCVLVFFSLIPSQQTINVHS